MKIQYKSEGGGYNIFTETCPTCFFCHQEVAKFYICVKCKRITCPDCRYLDKEHTKHNWDRFCECTERYGEVTKFLCEWKYEKKESESEMETKKPNVAIFECPGCKTQIEVAQTETEMKEPGQCACGRKGRFKLLSCA